MKSSSKSFHRKPKRNIFLPVVLGVLVLCLIVCFVVFGIMNGQDLHIQLEGSEHMQLEFGQLYTEPGAYVMLNGERMDVPVEVTGQIIPEKIGTYELTYRAGWLWRSTQKIRTVQIVDTTAPTIVLKHTDSVTLPGEDYVEEGYVAEDNYDGDITHLVQRKVEKDTVIYTVSDSSGNVTTVTRPIQYGDFTKPLLTLLGDKTVTIKAGTKFTEPGFEAKDNVDGDISDRVVVSGDYDIYTPGTYTIHYKVTDSHQNTTEVTRTLIVEKVSQPPVQYPGSKIVYLTFDDGPSKHTLRLLETLEKYNVKATFFVVGTAGLGYLDEIAAGGHAIGLHTDTHEFSQLYASVDAYFADLNAIRQKVLKYTGIDTTLIRFPGGSSNTVSRKYCEGIMTQLTKLVEDQGYQYFDWNVDSNDAGGAKSADEVFNNVINGLQQNNISIVLQHDIQGFSVDAVERIIIWGLANGYTFLPLEPSSPTVHHTPNN